VQHAHLGIYRAAQLFNEARKYRSKWKHFKATCAVFDAVHAKSLRLRDRGPIPRRTGQRYLAAGSYGAEGPQALDHGKSDAAVETEEHLGAGNLAGAVRGAIRRLTEGRTVARLTTEGSSGQPMKFRAPGEIEPEPADLQRYHRGKR
jgi:hypothetical protein